jgi:hypothetical protein
VTVPGATWLEWPVELRLTPGEVRGTPDSEFKFIRQKTPSQELMEMFAPLRAETPGKS